MSMHYEAAREMLRDCKPCIEVILVHEEWQERGQLGPCDANLCLWEVVNSSNVQTFGPADVEWIKICGEVAYILLK